MWERSTVISRKACLSRSDDDVDLKVTGCDRSPGNHSI